MQEQVRIGVRLERRVDERVGLMREHKALQLHLQRDQRVASGPHVRPDPNYPTRPRRGITADQLAVRDTLFRSDLLAGKRLLITGGGSGMGKAAAMLAARVAMCGRNPDKLAATQALIRAATGQEIVTAAVNIRDADAVDGFVGRVFDTSGVA